jgi:GTP-binding protein
MTRDMPVMHIVNKVDSLMTLDVDQELEDDHNLGLGTPLFISAEHKLNLGELARAIHPFYMSHQLRRSMELRMRAAREPNQPRNLPNEENMLRIALIGRANVGKSTMLNKLIGEERVVVSEIAGTTRDTIELSTTYEHEGQNYKILIADTAGIRKKKHIADDRVQTLSHEDTMRTIRFANVVCLLVDSQEPLTAEDLDIARMVEQEGRGMIVVANKWDLVKDPYVIANRIEATVASGLSQVKGLTVVVCSALTGKNLPLMVRKTIECYKRWELRIPTARLNQFMEKFLTTQSFPAYYPKIQYITQVSARPPKFALFFKGKEKVLPMQFERHILNAIREEFELGGVPIRIVQRSRQKDKEKKKRNAKKK